MSEITIIGLSIVVAGLLLAVGLVVMSVLMKGAVTVGDYVDRWVGQPGSDVGFIAFLVALALEVAALGGLLYAVGWLL